MSVRTYNPSVRVGNWNEDIQLEEDTLKDFLERRERGELLIQKTASLINSTQENVELSIARDGHVKFGDTVMLVNPASAGQNSRKACALGIMSDGSGGVAGDMNIKPCAKTSFVITSMDGSNKGDSLKYGQSFYLTAGPMFLYSDRATFQRSAKKSRNNPVSLVPSASHLTEWKIIPFDPMFRMELEFSEVPANQKTILIHVKTNQALCVESEMIRTMSGSEFEITTNTKLDSHRAEMEENHWMIVMNVPGDPMMPVEKPAEEQAAPPCTQ